MNQTQTIAVTESIVAGLPLADRDGVIWLDGELVPWRDARVHLLTHSLHYGSTVFEGERVYRGKIFKLREHTERLHASAKLVGYSLPYTSDEIDAACRLVVAENQIDAGYVRPLAWRGSEVIGVSGIGAKIHVGIAAFPWGSYYGDDAQRNGIKLQMSAWRRPNPNTAPTASKAAGLYMICTMSRDAAEAAGYHDALMLDYRGQLAEATGANLFLVIDGKLHTPTPDCFLDGITRKTVMDLARKRGYEVIERAIFPEELERAQEIFLTGTAVEIIPVGVIEQRTYAVGPITKQLQADFRALTATFE
jgi:branched-chain amino acid aminotransferase